MLRLGVPVWVVSLCFFLCAGISTSSSFIRPAVFLLAAKLNPSVLRQQNYRRIT